MLVVCGCALQDPFRPKKLQVRESDESDSLYRGLSGLVPLASGFEVLDQGECEQAWQKTTMSSLR